MGVRQGVNSARELRSLSQGHSSTRVLKGLTPSIGKLSNPANLCFFNCAVIMMSSMFNVTSNKSGHKSSSSSKFTLVCLILCLFIPSDEYLVGKQLF